LYSISEYTEVDNNQVDKGLPFELNSMEHKSIFKTPCLQYRIRIAV